MTTRRLITLRQAAEYCGISPASYRDWVAAGRVPGYVPGTRRIDKRALDRALDRLSGLEQTDDPFEEWLSRREQKRAGQPAAHSRGEETPA